MTCLGSILPGTLPSRWCSIMCISAANRIAGNEMDPALSRAGKLSTVNTKIKTPKNKHIDKRGGLI